MAEIWYCSKYVTPPYAAKNVGSRGFYLLREFARVGHACTLITSTSNHLAAPPNFDEPVMSESVDGVSVIWLRTLRYASAASVRRILSWFHFEVNLLRLDTRALQRPDVIIVSSLSPLTVLNGLLWRKKYRCKLVVEVRDIWPMVLTEAGKVSKYNPFVQFLSVIERCAFKSADYIVGTMPNLQQRVVEVLGYPKLVACIPQGLALEALGKEEDLPRSYLEQYVPRSKFIICHAGSIGVDNALETFLRCSEKFVGRSEVAFVLLGDGHLKKYYETQFGHIDNLYFCPSVKKTSVSKVLAEADVLYFAAHKSKLSNYGQSLNKLIDYMLAAKPIIGSYGGYPSMVNEAGCGEFIPAQDVEALSKSVEKFLVMQPSAREAIGQRGREWILRERTYEKLAGKYLEFIELQETNEQQKLNT